MKYIMFKRKYTSSLDQLVPVIFPDSLVHDEVAKLMIHCNGLTGSKAVSAGFIDIGTIDCHGLSETLSLKSLKSDSSVIQAYDYLHGLE